MLRELPDPNREIRSPFAIEYLLKRHAFPGRKTERPIPNHKRAEDVIRGMDEYRKFLGTVYKQCEIKLSDRNILSWIEAIWADVDSLEQDILRDPDLRWFESIEEIVVSLYDQLKVGPDEDIDPVESDQHVILSLYTEGIQRRGSDLYDLALGSKTIEEVLRLYSEEVLGHFFVQESENSNSKRISPETRNVDLFSLSQIASWQVHTKLVQASSIKPDLPALQRGYVWKARQIENLWDSLMRGFPIGSFMVTEMQSHAGHSSLALEEEDNRVKPTHLLLDGQQRATSIALGFSVPWIKLDSHHPAALWIDIGDAGSNDLQFCFRAVTKSHPWGYPKSQNENRLSVQDIRNAIYAYRKHKPDLQEGRRIPLTVTWPWDAIAPIPVAALIESCLSGNVKSTLIENVIKALPGWNLANLQTKTSESVLDAIHEAIASPHFGRIIEGIGRVIKGTAIPVLHLPTLNHPSSYSTSPYSQENQATRDALETLFIRVNSAGTPLQGEELMYSVIKSVYPKAKDLVESIPHRFIGEARVIMLLTRLILANREEGQDKAPPTPDLTRFRTLVHESDGKFVSQIESYLTDKNKNLFTLARHILVGTKEAGLPPVLAADLARGVTGSDAMLLLLRWLELLQKSGREIDTLTHKQRRRAIGTLTLFAWFSLNSTKTLNRLWSLLQKTAPEALPDFWSRKTLKFALSQVDRGSVILPPVLPPDLLEKTIENTVTKPRGNGVLQGFKGGDQEFWQQWNPWEHYSGRLPGKLKDWYQHDISGIWSDENSDTDLEQEMTYEKSLACWSHFANKLHVDRRFVLYAQRQQLIKWFEDYDPTDPTLVEEMNVPWDVDHILPQNYLCYRTMPCMALHFCNHKGAYRKTTH